MGFYPNLNKPKLSLKRHLKRVVEKPCFSKYREYANIRYYLKNVDGRHVMIIFSIFTDELFLHCNYQE